MDTISVVMGFLLGWMMAQLFMLVLRKWYGR